MRDSTSCPSQSIYVRSQSIHVAARWRSLLDAVEIYEQANIWSEQLLEDSDIKESERCEEAAKKAVSTAELLLNTLEGIGEGEAGEVVSFLLDATRRGQDLLIKLVDTQCQRLLCLPRISTILDRRWRGKLLDSVISGSVLPPFGDKIDLEDRRIRKRHFWAQILFSIPNRIIGSYWMRFIFFIAVVLVNLLVLPVVLLFPPLGSWIQTKLLPALGSEKKDKFCCFKQRVPWMLIFTGVGGLVAGLRLTNGSLSLITDLDFPIGLVLTTFGTISIVLGLTALVAGPYRAHTVAAKNAYSEFWRFHWTSLYLLDKPCVRGSNSR